MAQDREPHLWSYKVEGIYIPWSQVQAGGKRWLVLPGSPQTLLSSVSFLLLPMPQDARPLPQLCLLPAAPLGPTCLFSPHRPHGGLSKASPDPGGVQLWETCLSSALHPLSLRHTPPSRAHSPPAITDAYPTQRRGSRNEFCKPPAPGKADPPSHPQRGPRPNPQTLGVRPVGFANRRLGFADGVKAGRRQSAMEVGG